jgi:hypothetical protein
VIRGGHENDAGLPGMRGVSIMCGQKSSGGITFLQHVHEIVDGAGLPQKIENVVAIG